ncbi:MAG: aconitate hydratase AcnA [Anaerolineae bacterium]|nr:aconitate hydratase AcnA [Anaerolineae bacterium]
MSNKDEFKTRARLTVGGQNYTYYRLEALQEAGLTRLAELPYSIRVMLEAVLRASGGDTEVTAADVKALAAWKPQTEQRPALAFYPGRVLMQDFSGIPLLNDLAAMRAALKRLGGDPLKINPLIPVDLVVDHSLQVDYYGTLDAARRNTRLEFERNLERYQFLRWSQQTFKNFRVVPPSTGIIHQVNVEYLSQVVMSREENGELLVYPDSVVGTDSHTTMVNGLGVVGWGVGGIEAVAAMLNKPIEILTPDVIGFKLYGKLPAGSTPTDLTLTVVQMLRKKGVVDKFVEFFGPGLDHLTVADRTMIANMSPEHGATLGFFPIDAQTLAYLRQTGRSQEQVALVEAYARAQHLFREAGSPDPLFSDVLELDLGTVEPSLAGPRRPHERVSLKQVKSSFKQTAARPKAEGGFGLSPADFERRAALVMRDTQVELTHGDVVLAAITSCTNTSDPYVMLGAGLVAKKAVEKGLWVKPTVKTSITPGSRVVVDYLKQAGLTPFLEQLGFHLAGFGCATCIGNSGPLDEAVVKAITSEDLVAAAVFSGNRNFEGRVNPHTRANYLASPMLVVAYALAGTININFDDEALGTDHNGRPVYLKDIWPSPEEVNALVESCVTAEQFKNSYASVFNGNETWNRLPVGTGDMYEWKQESTYLQEPPFFENLSRERKNIADIHGARALAVFGDSVTTDHISPAGSIPVSSPAGQYLIAQGVQAIDFNSYGSRRGNDRVLTRATFANIRLKNRLTPDVEGSVTLHFPEKSQMSIYDAAKLYQSEGVPLVVLAGKEYGTGSSRDWAAKGPMLLGVKAVIAQSFERIHRSNLVGMGILPLQFQPGESIETLALNGDESFEIGGVAAALANNSPVTVTATRADGSRVSFETRARINTLSEQVCYQNGGILNTILLEMLA